MSSPGKKITVSLKMLLSGFVDMQEILDVTAITGLTFDSRAVVEGDLFIALVGTQVDGAGFISDAITKGAKAVLYESPVTEKVLQAAQLNNVALINVPRLRQCAGRIASRFYGGPSDKLKVVGVTGTDGKTSVSHFIAQGITFCGEACGVIGTLGDGIYGRLSEGTHTTPDAIEIHRLFAKFLPEASYVAMEVSSHALDQERVSGVKFDTAVFTNLSRDHLDYHGSMDSYWDAKQRLFNVAGLKHVVININDKRGLQLLRNLDSKVRKVVYGLDAEVPTGCDDWVIGRDIRLTTSGFEMHVQVPEKNAAQLSCKLFGRFNALNVLATIGVLRSLGVSLESALTAVSQLHGVPGRMEFFRAGNKPDVIVDYAHTPEALRTVLTSLREHVERKIWCVFGCGGDRDKGKRSMMGEVAEQLADYVILTNDNPRTEDPKRIVADIMQGIRNYENICVLPDRAEAIQFAVDSASAKDMILIAGKGHESYQIVGEKKIPYSDRETVARILKGAA